MVGADMRVYCNLFRKFRSGNQKYCQRTDMSTRMLYYHVRGNEVQFGHDAFLARAAFINV